VAGVEGSGDRQVCVDGDGGQGDAVGCDPGRQGDLDILEAVEGEAWLKPLGPAAPGDENVGSDRSAEVRDVEAAVGVEALGVAQAEGGAGGDVARDVMA
jgi:hypothetical protein